MRRTSSVVAVGLGVIATAVVVLVTVPRSSSALAFEPEAAAAARRAEPAESPAASGAPGDAAHVLSGRVLDAGGVPVAGAAVHLVSSAQLRRISLPPADDVWGGWSDEPTLAHGHLAKQLAEGHGGLTPDLSVKADAQGSFLFESLTGESFAVWATGTAHGAAMNVRAAPGESLELKLPPLRSITGRILGEALIPLKGARVWAVSRKTSLVVEAGTHADGTFAIEGLGEGPFYVLAAADGYLASGTRLWEAGPRTLELKLIRPRELEVRVLRGGKPAEATVEVLSNQMEQRQRAETREGRVRFEGMTRGWFQVWARSGSTASVPTVVLVRDLESSVTLHLHDGGRIQATAVDAAGQPIATPTLSLRHDSGSTLAEVKAKTGLPADFAPIGPGDYVVHAQAPGFEDTEVPVDLERGKVRVEVVMQPQRPATELSGRVLDRHGRGVPDAQVEVSGANSREMTDAQGRFTVSVPEAGPHVLTAYHSDLGRAVRQVVAPAENLELSLEGGASLRLMVSSNGRPVEGASAMVVAGSFGCLESGGPAFNSAGFSGPNGELWLHGLPPGTLVVHLRHPDHPPIPRTEAPEVVLGEGQALPVELELPPGATVEVEVVDTSGAPVADARVGIQGHETPETDSMGRMTARGVPLGRQQIYSVVRDGHPRADSVSSWFEAAETGAVARVVLERRVKQRGVVKTRDGRPLTRFRVNEQDFMDPTGRFELSVGPVNQYVFFTVEARGYRSVRTRVPADQEDLGTITLEPSPRFSGRVVDARGRGVMSAVVTCLTCKHERIALTREDGRFQLELPELGEHALKLTASKAGLTAAMDFVPTARRGILVLRSTARLVGTYYDDAGGPQVGVALQVGSTSINWRAEVVTDEHGTFGYEASPGLIEVQEDPTPGRQWRSTSWRVRHGQGGTQLAMGRAPGTFQLTVLFPGGAEGTIGLTPRDVEPGEADAAKVASAPWVAQSQLVASSKPETGRAVVFQGLSPGRYDVSLDLYSYQVKVGHARRQVVVGADHTLQIEASEVAAE